MSDETLANHILKKWEGELRSKDRGWDSVRPNFEELFFDLYKNNVPFEIAHGMLNQAIAAHFPNHFSANKTWNRVKKSEQYSGTTFKEFLDDWKKGIHDQGMEAFYSIYAPPADKTEETTKEETKYGNMSQKEYRLQRRYAESFPILDTTELEKRLAQGMDNYEDFFKDLDKILEKKNGNTETE